MYPIPASRALTLFEIADEWSRELKGRLSLNEMLTRLCVAWWGGEFELPEPSTRLNAIKALFEEQPKGIYFYHEEREKPQTISRTSDNGAVVLSVPLIPIPNNNFENWTDAACAAAYASVAKNFELDEFYNFRLALGCLVVTEVIFTNWIKEKRYERPTFWAEVTVLPDTEAGGSPQHSINSAPGRVPIQVTEFVRQYIADRNAMGRQPTKAGLESAAQEAGRRGGRERLRKAFDDQMGSQAPGRGRPAK